MPDERGTRAWLADGLRSDEVVPTVLEADEPHRVLWSTLWPHRPEDVIELLVEPAARDTTRLRSTHLTPHDLPPDAKVGHLRERVNQLLFADLRFSYGQ
ncbi:hypothetical protein [Nocardioides sp. IC4_145]|uniref:hypothetical protein n=1 Tax=Nocardioides sp. IC4_145 TaxID=2714037 RepID=UPI001A995077|nr:hypothetical protein [Nocardioides sp. IC4_145]